MPKPPPPLWRACLTVTVGSFVAVAATVAALYFATEYLLPY